MNKFKLILRCESGNTFFNVILPIFLVIFVLTFSTFLLNKSASESEYKWESQEKFEIHSLKDTSSLKGKAFLGSGNVEDEMYYYYMEKTPEGGFNQKKVLSSESTIYYLKDESQPYIENVKRKYESTFFNIFAERPTRTNIYIPEGSVVEDYKINLE